MESTNAAARQAHRLIQFGVLLFLLGLLTGLAIPGLRVPRLGVSAHMNALLGGMFLAIAGLVWPRLGLGAGASRIWALLTVYGISVGWGMALLAAAWGAGGALMPIAGGSAQGSSAQEAVISAGLVSGAIALVAACAMMVWKLRRFGGV